MSLVLDEIGAFVRREEVWNELVELGGSLVARQVSSLKLDQLLRDFDKEVRVSEVRFQIGDQVYGRTFWNHAEAEREGRRARLLSGALLCKSGAELHRAIIDTSFSNLMARRLEAKTAASASLLQSFDEFHFNRNADVAFVVCVSQKFADGRASDLTIIASEFIHVHADEFAGELPVHVVRVCE
jgi:hypothetical protein